jgi:hypothetical protein
VKFLLLSLAFRLSPHPVAPLTRRVDPPPPGEGKRIAFSRRGCARVLLTTTRKLVIARSVSDEAIQYDGEGLDCFASLAMTKE